MKKGIYGFALIIACICTLTSCKEEAKKAMKTPTIRFQKEGELLIHKKDNTTPIALDIEIAESDYETETGLMHRDQMAKNQGMLFIFEDVRMHAFYMKNTKIPLDIIFLDENLRIASFKKNAIPMDESSLSSEVPVQYVLEVNAGLVNQWGLKTQDSISFSRQ
ncbi:DUF192 domain-containing protein [Spongiimicrobium salis]|uniref:DUF192 domain-containing protein n=1 Tax=Spongiimicrobium salis TaxID=1667022 RepID=UPI00374D4DEB